MQVLTTHSPVVSSLSGMQLEVSRSITTGLSLRTQSLSISYVQSSSQGGLQLHIRDSVGLCFWERTLISLHRPFQLASPTERPIWTSASVFLGSLQAQHKEYGMPGLKLGGTPAAKQGTGITGIGTCSWSAFCGQTGCTSPLLLKSQNEAGTFSNALYGSQVSLPACFETELFQPLKHQRQAKPPWLQSSPQGAPFLLLC